MKLALCLFYVLGNWCINSHPLQFLSSDSFSKAIKKPYSVKASEVVILPPEILQERTNTSRLADFENITHLPKIRHRRNGGRLSSCNVVISEINSDNPGPNQKQFIELERICKEPITGRAPKKPLLDYKLIIVRAVPLSIVFALDLADSKITYSDDEKRGRFFVIGSKNVAKVTIDIQTSDAVQSILKRPDNIELLPTGDDSEYAVILFEHPQKIVRNQISLFPNPRTGLFEPNESIKEPLFFNIVKTNAKDMLVYGRKVSSSTCSFFDNLYPDFLQNQGINNYFFRDWDPQSALSEDLSINRCTDGAYGFVPATFKLGKISPGEQNNCDGCMVNLENIVNVQSDQVSDSIEMLDICETEDDSDIPLKRFKSISESGFHSYVQDSINEAKSTCASKVENGVAFSSSVMQVEVRNQLIKRLGYLPKVADYKKHRFDPNWVEQCKAHLPYGSSILANKDTQLWLDINVQSNKCLFSCFACKFYFTSGFRVDVKHKSNMETNIGFWSPQAPKNKQQIINHEKKSTHILAKKFLIEFSASKKEGEFLAAIKKAEAQQHEAYLPTIRMVRLVYAEIIAGVSYRKHAVFVDVVKSFEVNIGVHHYHATAAKQITAVISTSFHETLINHLVDQNLEFSLMVDESTDSVNVPYMICYIQTLEDGYPIVYLYSLIYLKYGQTATQLFQSFEEQVKLDNSINPNFELFFKTKLVAIATDGASVMRGIKNSFWTEINKYVERKIPALHCMAHKLELSVKRALITKAKTDTNFIWFKSFEQKINNFYTFYMSRGSKRWLHLVQVGEELNLQTKRIRYHFDLRWSSSYFYVIKSLHDNLDVLRVDLVAMEADETFTPEAKNTAADLHLRLTDKTYCITIMEYADFLSVYKQISLTLQKSSGLLMGKHDIIQTGINKLENLKQKPGEFVSDFLALTSCADVCVHGTCTFQQYDQCPRIIYRKPNKNPDVSPIVQELTNNDPNPIFLSEKRTAMYQSLIDELKLYFNLELLESFDLFNPNKYKLPKCAQLPKNDDKPIESAESDTHSLLIDNYMAKVTSVCEFLEVKQEDCVNFGADWKILMFSILNNLELVKNFQEDDVSRFWPLALTYSSLPWTGVTKRIIQTVLVIPFSSSDCERGFRYVTTIKSNERSRLTPSNLQHLVRIKVNGPQDLRFFQADKYAELFLQKHVRVDDETASGGRKFKTEAFKSFFRDSRLF